MSLTVDTHRPGGSSLLSPSFLVSCSCVPKQSLGFCSHAISWIRYSQAGEWFVCCLVCFVHRESYKLPVSKPQPRHRRNQNKIISNDHATVSVVSHPWVKDFYFAFKTEIETTAAAAAACLQGALPSLSASSRPKAAAACPGSWPAPPIRQVCLLLHAHAVF